MSVFSDHATFLPYSSDLNDQLSQSLLASPPFALFTLVWTPAGWSN